MTIDRNTHGTQDPEWYLLSEFELPDEPDREEQMISLISAAIEGLDFLTAHLAWLHQILIDAVKKVIRPADAGLSSTSISIRLFASITALRDRAQPPTSAKATDSIQGWGYFLINRWAAYSASRDNHRRVIELYLYPEGGIGRVTPADLSNPKSPL